MPSSSSKSGHTMQTRILGTYTFLYFFSVTFGWSRVLLIAADQRKALERREGDRERGETEAERMEEEEMIKKHKMHAAISKK